MTYLGIAQFVYVNGLLQTDAAGGGQTQSDKDMSSESSQPCTKTSEDRDSKDLRREDLQQLPEDAKNKISKQVWQH